MPRLQDLPESLQPLARRQATELSDTRWEYDVRTFGRKPQTHIRCRSPCCDTAVVLTSPRSAISGRREKVEVATEPAGYQECPHCRERIALGAKVCEFCRKEVTSPVSVSPQASFASTPHVSAPTDSQKGALLEQHTPTLVTEGIARASPGGQDQTTTDDSSVSLESNRIWLWIDRLLPAGTIVLAQIIFGFGTSLGRVWEFLGPDFKIFALLCPLAAATICAIVSDRSKSRLAIRALAILSFTTPLIVFCLDLPQEDLVCQPHSRERSRCSMVPPSSSLQDSLWQSLRYHVGHKQV